MQNSHLPTLPQEANLASKELALLVVQVKAVFTKVVQDDLYIIYILLIGLTKDKDIIKVDNIDSIKEPSKGLINISLEDSRGISEAEGYHCIFKVPIPCIKYSLLVVLLLNRNLVIGILEVKFSEELHST